MKGNKKMGYRRETRDIVEETIKKLAVDVQECIKGKPTIDRDAAIAAKTNALANLIRTNAEAMSMSGNVEKEIANLREELKRYGINLN